MKRSTPIPSVLLSFALGATLLLAGCAAPHRQTASEIAPSVPVTTSVAQADGKLEEVKRQRAAVEAQFAERERVCYSKFFVNNCLDTAKETRRATLAALRAIEIEASHYKRVESVERRDAALAEQSRQDAADAAARAALPPKVPAVERAAPPPPKAAGKSQAQRVAEHNARVKAAAAKDAAEEEKRQAKAASFEKKKADSLKRQQALAEKQAAKAEKLRARAAAKQAEADAAAAAAAASAAKN